MSYYVIIPYSYMMRMLYEKEVFLFYLWSLELGHNTTPKKFQKKGNILSATSTLDNSNFGLPPPISFK